MLFSKIPKSSALKHFYCFSTTTPMPNQFDFKFDVFPSEDSPKRFYLPSKSSIFSVENLIKSGDSSIKTIDFSSSDSSPINKSSNFLEFVLKSNLKLSVNSHPFAYKIDGFQDLGYFTNSKYDGFFKEKELPFPQVSIFSSIFKAYETRFAKESQNEATMTAKQLQDNLIQVLKNFSEINQKTVTEIETNLEQCIHDFESEKKKLQRLEAQLSKEARKILKFWLIVTTAQFFILFYICYYAYGWDFTEPIGYLISLGIETATIGYFLKFRGELGQNSLFFNKLKTLKPAVLT